MAGGWRRPLTVSAALVTGGGGFIGSHLVDRLLADGWRVRVLDNFTTGRRQNLRHCLAHIDLIEGDVRDPECVEKAVRGVEIVFHQAALPSVPRSIADPVTTNAVNAVGTLNLLDAARRAGVRRMVYAASSSAYGDTPVLPKTEDMPPKPQSPYAVSKLTGEYYVRVFTQVYGFEGISLRYFNVFGPRQDPTSQYAAVIPRFIAAMLRGERPVIFGDGEQSRDFTYVANVVEANMLAARCPRARGEVINIACGAAVSLNELVRSINGILGTSLKPIYADPRPGDVRHSLASLDRAAALLGYAPRLGFFDGLRRTIEWLASGSFSYGGSPT